MPLISVYQSPVPIDVVDRGSGVHLTGIVRDYLVRLGIEKAYSDDGTPESEELRNTFFALGYAWEDYLRKHGEIGDSLGCVTVDGVMMTVDGITWTDEKRAKVVVERYRRQGLLGSLERGELAHATGGIELVHEVKWTSKWRPDSVDEEIRKLAAMAYWHYQLACYCGALGAKSARRHVVWMCDARGRVLPLHRGYDYAWDEGEAEAAWEKMVEYYNSGIMGSAE